MNVVQCLGYDTWRVQLTTLDTETHSGVPTFRHPDMIPVVSEVTRGASTDRHRFMACRSLQQSGRV